MVAMGARSERVVAAVLADMGDLPYFRVDVDRNVVEVSRAMELMTGFRAADVVGRSCLQLHRCEECLAGCGVFDSRVVRNKRLELYRADGTTLDVIKSGRVFVDERGEIAGAFEVVRPFDGEAAPKPNDELGRIRSALERSQYSRTRAARLLGVSRTTLWRRMKELGLSAALEGEE